MSSATAYAAGQTALYSGYVYNCKLANTNNPPSADLTSTYWTLGPVAYNSGTTYNLNQTATSGGLTYISLQNGNVGNPVATSPTWWAVVAWNFKRGIGRYADGRNRHE